MKIKWILAVMGSLWACFAHAQDSITRHKPQFKFSISAGTSYEFWTLDKKSSYTRKMQQEAGMKVKFRSEQGINLGSQLTIAYNPTWLLRMEGSLQYTQNYISVSFEEPTGHQINWLRAGHIRANLTLLPLGYLLQNNKGYSLAIATGIGIYGNIGSLGGEGWGPYAANPGGLFSIQKSKCLPFFYATQLQAGYKRWHIAANMNWQMQLPNDEHYFNVDHELKGFCAYNYHTLDLRIGYQF